MCPIPLFFAIWNRFACFVSFNCDKQHIKSCFFWQNRNFKVVESTEWLLLRNPSLSLDLSPDSIKAEQHTTHLTPTLSGSLFHLLPCSASWSYLHRWRCLAQRKHVHRLLVPAQFCRPFVFVSSAILCRCDSRVLPAVILEVKKVGINNSLLFALSLPVLSPIILGNAQMQMHGSKEQQYT